MPVLHDTALAINAKAGMIKPFNADHISPSSVDLTLDDHILVESLDDNSNGWVEMDITTPYSLTPGQFVLASTAEVIAIPPDCCAQIILRSSAARAGFDHCLAGWIDSGWEGQITLELRNNLQLRPLQIHAGQRLVQLVVHKLVAPPAALYGVKGNYQHQRRTTPSNNNLSAIS